MIYYVLRDKSTGLYWRGKGENRWGKYFNQASVYRVKGQVENTLKELAHRKIHVEIVPVRIFENTLDVVEVVRCKDCEFYDDKSILGNQYGGRCIHIHLSCHKCDNYRKTTPHNFCSYGKRKENTND